MAFCSSTQTSETTQLSSHVLESLSFSMSSLLPTMSTPFKYVASAKYQVETTNRTQWVFHQDGTIQPDIKLTGILNTYVMNPGEDLQGYGTQVKKGKFSNDGYDLQTNLTKVSTPITISIYSFSVSTPVSTDTRTRSTWLMLYLRMPQLAAQKTSTATPSMLSAPDSRRLANLSLTTMVLHLAPGTLSMRTSSILRVASLSRTSL